MRERRIYQNLEFRGLENEEHDSEVLISLLKQYPGQFKLANYIANYLEEPLCQNSTTKFLSSGENFFDELFNELKRAKKYILIEEFVIREGLMWNTLFEILKEKVRDGVEVKILYDKLGCKHAFSDKLTFRKLENYRIECVPFRSGVFGYSNHRKLIVVDGIVAFAGGINISDKYTNFKEVDTNWECSAIKITGDAVWRMTVGFFNDWQFSKGRLINDFITYKPEKMPKLKTYEFVQPVTLSPITNKDETKSLIIALINNATESINILSSYIVIDDDIVEAMKRARYSGVKVNVFTSSVSDRHANFSISRGIYHDLLQANINVLEYSNSFLRSKIISIDNTIAYVGTVALDTRWFNQMYENGVLVNGKETMREISKYIENINYKCKNITFKDLKERPFSQKLIAWLNRLTRFKM